MKTKKDRLIDILDLSDIPNILNMKTKEEIEAKISAIEKDIASVKSDMTQDYILSYNGKKMRNTNMRKTALAMRISNLQGQIEALKWILN